MNKLRALTAAVAVALAGAAVAQTQPPPDPSQPSGVPSTSPTEGTAADTTPPGQTPTTPQGTQQTSPPAGPSTSPTEGTAADTTPPGQTPTMQQQGQQTMPPAGDAAQQQDSTRMAMADMSAMDRHRASRLIDMDVKDMNGREIGEVEDVIIDQNGQVTHALVSYGGTLGFGTKLTAVPWSMLTAKVQGDAIVMDKAQLEQAPTLDHNNLPNFASADWSSQFDQYWSGDGTFRSATGPMPGTSPQQQQQYPQQQYPESQQQQYPQQYPEQQPQQQEPWEQSPRSPDQEQPPSTQPPM